MEYSTKNLIFKQFFKISIGGGGGGDRVSDHRIF